jgi:putative transcriptional regulator
MKKHVAKTKGKDSTSVGRSVIKSLQEIRAWQRGEGEVSVTEFPDPIAPERIKAIRKKAARSVQVFSRRFGLPANTVRQWEQGARRPDAASSLLLEVIDADPKVVESAAKKRQTAA